MGPQDPKDVARETARDLSALVGGLVALKGDATHWLTDPAYAIKKIKHTSRPNAVLTGIPPHLMMAQYG